MITDRWVPPEAEAVGTEESGGVSSSSSLSDLSSSVPARFLVLAGAFDWLLRRFLQGRKYSGGI